MSGKKLATHTKLHINVLQGIIDVEGDAELVKEIYADFKHRLLSSSKTESDKKSAQNTNASKEPKKPAAPTPAAKSNKASNKSKSIISMDKTLNLKPTGAASAQDFANEKSPTNVKHKCVVAVYYLRDIIKIKKVTLEAVYTYFKTVSWPIPTDLRNTLQQAGTDGHLDTADNQDIKITSIGENLVEYELMK